MTPPSLDDLRFAVTDAIPSTLIAVGLGSDVNAKAARFAKDHHIAVSILRPKDGFDLVAKVDPSGVRIDVSPPPPK